MKLFPINKSLKHEKAHTLEATWPCNSGSSTCGFGHGNLEMSGLGHKQTRYGQISSSALSRALHYGDGQSRREGPVEFLGNTQSYIP